MAEDGALYVATADEHLAMVPSGASALVNLTWPGDWSGSILPDGLAVAPRSASVLIAERSEDRAWLRMFDAGNIAHRRSFRLDGPLRGGVVALWPFAYFTVGSTVHHVDLNSGLLEMMTEVGGEAAPAAVVNG
jgi:hypothetical protein